MLSCVVITVSDPNYILCYDTMYPCNTTTTAELLRGDLQDFAIFCTDRFSQAAASRHFPNLSRLAEFLLIRICNIAFKHEMKIFNGTVFSDLVDAEQRCGDIESWNNSLHLR